MAPPPAFLPSGRKRNRGVPSFVLRAGEERQVEVPHCLGAELVAVVVQQRIRARIEVETVVQLGAEALRKLLLDRRSPGTHSTPAVCCRGRDCVATRQPVHPRIPQALPMTMFPPKLLRLHSLGPAAGLPRQRRPDAAPPVAVEDQLAATMLLEEHGHLVALPEGRGVVGAAAPGGVSSWQQAAEAARALQDGGVGAKGQVRVNYGPSQLVHNEEHHGPLRV
mmetsp:Transcript_118137/g.320620  ORF Transcript_118137/g.320620 Transcript_118137/m.320620 type:complete len:222 (+) Transcript_118137:436-1101(+)